MSRQTLLDRARRAKEGAMDGRCTLKRFTPARIDTGTLKRVDTNPDDDLIYDGKFRLKSLSSAVLALDADGQLLAQQQIVLCLPVDVAADVHVDDRGKILDGGRAPNLTGVGFRVSGLFFESDAVEARIPIQVLS